mmetsp:Transcript_25024/g.62928  ORF Transcript_25024/g.62928 Transcript_25024/m.62928 type:complete len:121 (+) Transcript_25024:183-545(+)|eukprot:CAMPEP_0178989702 /NCGR_PEP_ID=MMETSP0795-20121207/4528_1 /TAXON_ID=88552 /ORGANISM="Amoebophrya sp., Strain Ameob2" /LENGTH=120 /DNA_ID=CAMNT_0020681147 /DNA_START=310 /DNA_END=672 /DNA_ORIENTATION=+
MAKQLAAKMVVALTLAAGGGNTVEGVQLAFNPGEFKKKLATEITNADGNACNAFDDAICRQIGNETKKGNLKKKAGAKHSPKSIPGLGGGAAGGLQAMSAITERCCENDASAKDGSTSCA